MIQTPTSRLAGPSLRRESSRRAARALVRGRAVSTSGGFTLTEILIAIALILIIGSLAVVNFERIAGGIGDLSTPKALQAEIREARFLALQRRSPVILMYNAETHSFDLIDQQGQLLDSVPDGADDEHTSISLTFTSILPLKDLATDPNPKITNASGLDDSIEYSKKGPVPTLLFDPSGVTAPVKVTLTIEGQSNPIEYRLDSFSEGPPPKPPETTPIIVDE